METRIKIIIASILILAIVILAWIIKMQNDIIQRQSKIEHDIVEFKQLGQGIVRLESKYVDDSKALESKLAGLGVDLDNIKEDMKKQNVKMDSIAAVVGRTPGNSGTNIPSSFVEHKPEEPKPSGGNTPPQPDQPKTCLNQFGYCENVQGLKLEEPTGLPEGGIIPVGVVRFDSTKKNPWTFKVYSRKYYSVLTFGKDLSGRTIAYSKMMVEAETEDGRPQKQTIGINEAYFNEILEDSRMYWWNPRLMAGWTPGVSLSKEFSSIFSLQMFFSAYASNRARPRWSFLGLGIGYDAGTDMLTGIVTPVAYNLFPKTSLVQNVYAAPSIGVGKDITFGATLGFML